MSSEKKIEFKDEGMKRWIFRIFRIVGYLIGFGILFYPAFSNYLNQKNSTTVAANYEQEVSHLADEEEARILEEAREYNRNLIGQSNFFADPFLNGDEEVDESYQNTLNLDGSGMMGYLQIPKIHILLPIYHGTSEPVLQVGAGHIMTSSLPVGGISSHAVLSGHRGLPSAELFTNLNQLAVGDVFYIKIMHETLAYQVDQILTVLPEETEALHIEEGRDLVTLVTCTPYAVNSHRLLVRGRRIAYEEAEEVTKQPEVKAELPLYLKALIVGIIVVITLQMTVWILAEIKERKKDEE